MRVIAGQWKGRVIEAPQGRLTRPTSDRVREALFSTVFSVLGELEGRAVIDLYAGSGALGIEALSRGAAFAFFVESNPSAYTAINKNLSSLGAQADKARIVPGTVGQPHVLRAIDLTCSLLFADPPYRIHSSEIADVLVRFAQAGVLEAGALIVYEHASGAGIAWPIGFTAVSEKRYGSTAVSFATYDG